MKLRLLLVFLIGAVLSSPAQQHSNTLTWAWSQGTGDAATGFHIRKASVSGGPYTTIATVLLPAMTYVDLAVVSGQTNYYVVTAYNTGGDSTPSNQVICVTPFQAPSTPTGLQGTVI